MVRQIQKFEVSLKIFILDGERALFVREADTGYWELPGGRIDVGEEWEAHERVLAREIREELGPEISVRIGPEAVTWARQRPSDSVYQFIVARIGHLEGGNIILSAEHSTMRWLERRESVSIEFPPASGYADAIQSLWDLTRR